MKKIGLVAFTSFVLIGCNSTQTVYTPPTTLKLEGITVKSGTKTLKEAYMSIAEEIGVEVKATSNNFGSAEWFSYDSSAPSYELRGVLLDEIYPQLLKSCTNKFGITENLSAAYAEGNFDPLEYGISSGDKKLLLETYTNSSVLYLRHNDSKAKDFRGHVNDKFETADGVANGLADYTKMLMNEVNKQLYIDTVFICSDNGKINEAIAVGRKPKTTEPSGHYAVYLGENILNKYISKNLNDALDYVRNIRLPKQNKKDRKRAIRLAREKAKEQEKLAFIKQQKDALAELNKVEKGAGWKMKEFMLRSASPGDKVCSYKGNKMGFIERVSGDMYKVLWKGFIENQPDGFFFGNKQFSIMSKTVIGDMNYRYVPINDMTWVDFDSIGTCSHQL